MRFPLLTHLIIITTEKGNSVYLSKRHERDSIERFELIASTKMSPEG